MGVHQFCDKNKYKLVLITWQGLLYNVDDINAVGPPGKVSKSSFTLTLLRLGLLRHLRTGRGGKVTHGSKVTF